MSAYVFLSLRVTTWTKTFQNDTTNNNTHTHSRLTALFPGLPGWASTRKVKPIWILVKQETVNGNGISWAICKSAPCSRQITTPAPHHSVFYRPDALPAASPTVSKHWRHNTTNNNNNVKIFYHLVTVTAEIFRSDTMTTYSLFTECYNIPQLINYTLIFAVLYMKRKSSKTFGQKPENASFSRTP